MRTLLARKPVTYQLYYGTFIRWGYDIKDRGNEKLALVQHITDRDQNYICEHCWLEIEYNLSLRMGAEISFRGLPQSYDKKSGADYNLNNIKDVKIL